MSTSNVQVKVEPTDPDDDDTPPPRENTSMVVPRTVVPTITRQLPPPELLLDPMGNPIINQVTSYTREGFMVTQKSKLTKSFRQIRPKGTAGMITIKFESELPSFRKT